MKQNFRIQYYLRIANVSSLPLFHSWFAYSAATTFPNGVQPQGRSFPYPPWAFCSQWKALPVHWAGSLLPFRALSFRRYQNISLSTTSVPWRGPAKTLLQLWLCKRQQNQSSASLQHPQIFTQLGCLVHYSAITERHQVLHKQKKQTKPRWKQFLPHFSLNYASGQRVKTRKQKQMYNAKLM